METWDLILQDDFSSYVEGDFSEPYSAIGEVHYLSKRINQGSWNEIATHHMFSQYGVKWSIEKRNKHTNDINPDIICKLAVEEALEGVEEWGHPNPDLDFNKDKPRCYNGMYFTTYEKDKKYKYNNYDEIKKWSIEVIKI